MTGMTGTDCTVIFHLINTQTQTRSQGEHKEVQIAGVAQPPLILLHTCFNMPIKKWTLLRPRPVPIPYIPCWVPPSHLLHQAPLLGIISTYTVTITNSLDPLVQFTTAANFLGSYLRPNFSFCTCNRLGFLNEKSELTHLNLPYCERSELLICKVHQFGLGCIKNCAHCDQSENHFGTSLYHFGVVIFGTSLILYSVILWSISARRMYVLFIGVFVFGTSLFHFGTA